MASPEKRKKMDRIQGLIEALQRNMDCPICLDMAKNPVATRCGHKFCNHCLVMALGKKRSIPCPLCKESVTPRSLQPLVEWGRFVTAVQNIHQAFLKDTAQMVCGVTSPSCSPAAAQPQASNASVPSASTTASCLAGKPCSKGTGHGATGGKQLRTNIRRAAVSQQKESSETLLQGHLGDEPSSNITSEIVVQEGHLSAEISCSHQTVGSTARVCATKVDGADSVAASVKLIPHPKASKTSRQPSSRGVRKAAVDQKAICEQNKQDDLLSFLANASLDPGLQPEVTVEAPVVLEAQVHGANEASKGLQLGDAENNMALEGEVTPFVLYQFPPSSSKPEPGGEPSTLCQLTNSMDMESRRDGTKKTDTASLCHAGKNDDELENDEHEDFLFKSLEPLKKVPRQNLRGNKSVKPIKNIPRKNARNKSYPLATTEMHGFRDDTSTKDKRFIKTYSRSRRKHSSYAVDRHSKRRKSDTTSAYVNDFEDSLGEIDKILQSKIVPKQSDSDSDNESDVQIIPETRDKVSEAPPVQKEAGRELIDLTRGDIAGSTSGNDLRLLTKKKAAVASSLLTARQCMNEINEELATPLPDEECIDTDRLQQEDSSMLIHLGQRKHVELEVTEITQMNKPKAQNEGVGSVLRTRQIFKTRSQPTQPSQSMDKAKLVGSPKADDPYRFSSTTPTRAKNKKCRKGGKTCGQPSQTIDKAKLVGSPKADDPYRFSSTTPKQAKNLKGRKSKRGKGNPKILCRGSTMSIGPLDVNSKEEDLHKNVEETEEDSAKDGKKSGKEQNKRGAEQKKTEEAEASSQEYDSLQQLISEAEDYDLVFSQQVRDMQEEATAEIMYVEETRSIASPKTRRRIKADRVAGKAPTVITRDVSDSATGMKRSNKSLSVREDMKFPHGHISLNKTSACKVKNVDVPVEDTQHPKELTIVPAEARVLQTVPAEVYSADVQEEQTGTRVNQPSDHPQIKQLDQVTSSAGKSQKQYDCAHLQTHTHTDMPTIRKSMKQEHTTSKETKRKSMRFLVDSLSQPSEAGEQKEPTVIPKQPAAPPAAQWKDTEVMKKDLLPQERHRVLAVEEVPSRRTRRSNRLQYQAEMEDSVAEVDIEDHTQEHPNDAGNTNMNTGQVENRAELAVSKSRRERSGKQENENQVGGPGSSPIQEPVLPGDKEHQQEGQLGGEPSNVAAVTVSPDHVDSSCNVFELIPEAPLGGALDADVVCVTESIPNTMPSSSCQRSLRSQDSSENSQEGSNICIPPSNPKSIKNMGRRKSLIAKKTVNKSSELPAEETSNDVVCVAESTQNSKLSRRTRSQSHMKSAEKVSLSQMSDDDIVVVDHKAYAGSAHTTPDKRITMGPVYTEQNHRSDKEHHSAKQTLGVVACSDSIGSMETKSEDSSNSDVLCIPESTQCTENSETRGHTGTKITKSTYRLRKQRSQLSKGNETEGEEGRNSLNDVTSVLYKSEPVEEPASGYVSCQSSIVPPSAGAQPVVSINDNFRDDVSIARDTSKNDCLKDHKSNATDASMHEKVRDDVSVATDISEDILLMEEESQVSPGWHDGEDNLEDIVCVVEDSNDAKGWQTSLSDEEVGSRPETLESEVLCPMEDIMQRLEELKDVRSRDDIPDDHHGQISRHNASMFQGSGNLNDIHMVITDPSIEELQSEKSDAHVSESSSVSTGKQSSNLSANSKLSRTRLRRKSKVTEVNVSQRGPLDKLSNTRDSSNHMIPDMAENEASNVDSKVISEKPVPAWTDCESQTVPELPAEVQENKTKGALVWEPNVAGYVVQGWPEPCLDAQSPPPTVIRIQEVATGTVVLDTSPDGCRIPPREQAGLVSCSVDGKCEQKDMLPLDNEKCEQKDTLPLNNEKCEQKDTLPLDNEKCEQLVGEVLVEEEGYIDIIIASAEKYDKNSPHKIVEDDDRIEGAHKNGEDTASRSTVQKVAHNHDAASVTQKSTKKRRSTRSARRLIMEEMGTSNQGADNNFDATESRSEPVTNSPSSIISESDDSSHSKDLNDLELSVEKQIKPQLDKLSESCDAELVPPTPPGSKKMNMRARHLDQTLPDKAHDTSVAGRESYDVEDLGEPIGPVPAGDLSFSEIQPTPPIDGSLEPGTPLSPLPLTPDGGGVQEDDVAMPAEEAVPSNEVLAVPLNSPPQLTPIKVTAKPPQSPTPTKSPPPPKLTPAKPLSPPQLTPFKTHGSIDPSAPIIDCETANFTLEEEPASPEGDRSCDQECSSPENSSRLNQTSSSALSSQSEPVDTQHKECLQEDLHKIADEIAELEAALLANKTDLPDLTTLQVEEEDVISMEAETTMLRQDRMKKEIAQMESELFSEGTKPVSLSLYDVDGSASDLSQNSQTMTRNHPQLKNKGGISQNSRDQSMARNHPQKKDKRDLSQNSQDQTVARNHPQKKNKRDPGSPSLSYTEIIREDSEASDQEDESKKKPSKKRKSFQFQSNNLINDSDEDSSESEEDPDVIPSSRGSSKALRISIQAAGSKRSPIADHLPSSPHGASVRSMSSTSESMEASVSLIQGRQAKKHVIDVESSHECLVSPRSPTPPSTPVESSKTRSSAVMSDIRDVMARMKNSSKKGGSSQTAARQDTMASTRRKRKCRSGTPSGDEETSGSPSQTPVKRRPSPYKEEENVPSAFDKAVESMESTPREEFLRKVEGETLPELPTPSRVGPVNRKTATVATMPPTTSSFKERPLLASNKIMLMAEVSPIVHRKMPVVQVVTPQGKNSVNTGLRKVQRRSGNADSVSPKDSQSLQSRTLSSASASTVVSNSESQSEIQVKEEDPPQQLQSPAKSPLVAFPSKPSWVIVMSGIKSLKVKSRIEHFVKSIGARISPRFTRDATHLILQPDSSSGDTMLCSRTLKYFQALAGHRWLLHFRWVLDSLKKAQILPEEDYEMQGDTVNGNHEAPRRSRLATKPLLGNFEICCPGALQDLSRDELHSLIEACGASVVHDPSMFSFDPIKRPVVLIQDDENKDTAALRRIHQMYEVPVVDKDWLLDCIGSWALQRLADHAVQLN